MTQPKPSTVREPIPDWWFIGVLVVVLGGPMMVLVGAAFLRNPPVIVVLGTMFAASTWWFFQGQKAAKVVALPPPPKPRTAPANPVAQNASSPDTSAWVPWQSLGERHTKARPLRLESSLSKESWLQSLATRVPPLDTDLRFTTKVTTPSSDRWMDVDDAGDHARLSLHIEGFSFPRVVASAGIDGVIHQSPSGCRLDLWVRPSGRYRGANLVAALMYAGLALVWLGGAVASAIDGETGEVVGLTLLAACFVALGLTTIRAQRRLAKRLVDELVAAVEKASASTALTPPASVGFPPPPARVFTPTEQAVHHATTQVRIGQPNAAAGCLPTVAVMTSAVLLILGSIVSLGS